MSLNDLLQNVSVLGAGGKMGSGISLLLLQEIARLELELTGHVGSGKYCLNLVDSREQSLGGLKSYLKGNLIKYAEKNINLLRLYYSNNPLLISNEEIVDAFIEGALDIIHFETNLENTKQTSMVFEAILEELETKVHVFKQIAKNNPRAYFFTNTSSIPIHFLNEEAKLQDRLIGFHFYNPPAVQKLVEIVSIKSNELEKIAFELLERLQKIGVQSHDVAGFIGNGYFIREIIFACQKVKELTKDWPIAEAIYLVNHVTQKRLSRPMGIFQLMDYVGLDVCQNICKIMKKFLKDPSLQIEMVDQMVEKGVIGGQNPDGSQKSGFLQYRSKKIEGVYILPEHRYRLLLEDDWKGFTGEKELAEAFLANTKKIVQKLVNDGVANNVEDVKKVLFHGFGVKW